MGRQGRSSAPLFRTLEVTDLAGRGDGVARLPTGEVVFLPGTAPGDRVDARIEGRRGGVLRGEVLRLQAPGASRVTPPCPVAERCGGCSWLHVALDRQHAVKAELAARALAPDAAPSRAGGAPALGWRRRVRLHLRTIAGKPALGLLEAGSDRLVPLHACPAMVPALSERLPVWRQAFGPWLERGELLAVQGSEGIVLAVHGRRRSALPDAAALDALSEGLHGLVLELDGDRFVRGAADATLEETRDDGAPVRCSAGGFAQASADGNRAIRAAVGRALADAVQARGSRFGRALEAFAGSGNLTTLALEAAEHVRTIEFDEAAVHRARASLAAFGSDRLRIETGDVGEAPTLPGGADALWLLDPGRPGAAELMRRAAATRPAAIVYVSCAPDTLRRDLGALRAAGYAVRHAVWLDTMPNTPHFELVVRLELAGT